MNIDINEMNDAAVRAGLAGDLRGLVQGAGWVAQAVRQGHQAPEKGGWLWDPRPVLNYGHSRQVAPPLALGGPMLTHLWSDNERHNEVEEWLAEALARAYAMDYSRSTIGRDDRAANTASLEHGSRLLFPHPWFGQDVGGDLWIFVEAAHGPDARFRRVSCLHRSDY